MTDTRNESPDLEDRADEDVWARFVAGNDDALFELMGRHGESLYRYLLLTTGRVRNAAEMTAETWALLSAWRRPFEGFGGFREWLYAVATQNFMPPTRPETAGLGDVIDEFAGREAGVGLGAVVYRVVALLRHLRIPVLLRVAGFDETEMGRICNFRPEKARRCWQKGCKRLASVPEFPRDDTEDESEMHARVISTLRALELPEADAAVLEYVHRCVNEAVERQPKMPHAPADPTPERTAAWKAGVVMGALVAALIVLLGVLAYVARTYDPPPSVGQPLDMAGDVQAKDYGARNYHPLHEGARLYAGLSLRTDRGARFAAEADTAVLYVDETTELAFGPPGAYALAIGRIHAEHTSEKGPPVEIMTAPARVFVKNGRTVLRSDGERITAFCLSGTATLARSGQEDVVLEPGQAGAVGREGISTTVRPFAKPYQTHWLRRFASMPGGPRSYDELMCLAANQLWPPVADGDGDGIEALEIDLRLDGPLAALDVTSSDGARPGPGQAFLSGTLGGGWTMQRNGARGRLFAALLRQQETFRLGIAPDALTNRPIRRVALHLPGIEPAFSGTQWQREGDTWSATHVDPHRGIVLELPAEAVAERGTLAKGTGGEGHGDVTGRLLPYDPQGDLWLERGSRIVVVFDRAGFAGERQFTRACLFVDRFLRHMTPHVSCMVIDAVEVPAGPAPATGPRIDRIMARLWDAPTEDHAEPGFADIMRLALAASSDLEQPLVLAVTGSAFDLPEQGSRLVGERPLIVCRVPPPAADRGADGTADPGTRPYRGFWNERRVLWTLPPELPVELGVRILLTSMRSPGVPQSALPEGHRMLQADFTAQPVVTAREGHSTR